tara:strand:+ start:780 stop:977 length:198 start_codon:yes stop_codon:yes gene_type:complete
MKIELRTTELFIVIDEETLLTAKGKGNKTAKFETEEQAWEWASERLNLWCVVKIHFKHEWIEHKI